MWINIILLIVFIACVACLYTDGMWSNAITLFNVVNSSLLAFNFFEPVANWLDGQMPSFTYVWDFMALWGLFGLFMLIFRLSTDFLSNVKVRFLKIADRIGSLVLAGWIGWVMVCFTATTLHTAPLARNFLGGSFKPEERMFMNLAPDRQWLGFVQKMSMGTYARSASEQDAKAEKYVFDPGGDFMPKYATRRAQVESSVSATGSIRAR